MSKTTRLALVKPTHGINEVEGTTSGVPNEALNLDLIDAAIAALQDKAAVTDYTTAGAITQKSGNVTLSGAGALAMSLADPTAVTDDGKRLTIVCKTAHANVLTVTGGLGGGAHNTITFGGAVGDLTELEALGGKWFLLPSINATASTV